VASGKWRAGKPKDGKMDSGSWSGMTERTMKTEAGAENTLCVEWLKEGLGSRGGEGQDELEVFLMSVKSSVRVRSHASPGI
jgi:hypothetical protein